MSAQLLHIEGRFIDADPWTLTGPDDALPAGPALVTLDRWRVEREALLARAAPVGVVLEPGQPLEELAADLPRIACIALRFTSPEKDGPTAPPACCASATAIAARSAPLARF